MDRDGVRDAVQNSPQFIHDCEACTFLGRYYGKNYEGDAELRHADLYHCSGEPTVIARFSSDGPDYSSGMVFTEGPGPTLASLVEARRRAEEMGLKCTR